MGDRFISVRSTMSKFNWDKKETIEHLNFLEEQGYIEKSEIDEAYWQISVRGRVLTSRVFPMEFKMKTLNKHLAMLMERVKEVNSSNKYPYSIKFLKVISQYPIENQGTGIKIAFCLDRKLISEKEYEEAAQKLREEYKGYFGNIVDNVYYPHKAIADFLKSKSKILRIREYSEKEIMDLEGHIVFVDNAIK